MFTIANTFGDDECFMCSDASADTRLPCGHRTMCKGCAVKHIAAAVAKRKTPWCPSCRKDYNQFDECQLQLEPLKMGSSLNRPVAVVDRHGVRSADETHFIAGSVTRVNRVDNYQHTTEETISNVRRALRLLNIGEITLEELDLELTVALKADPHAMAVAFIELAKENDMHKIISTKFSEDMKAKAIRVMAQKEALAITMATKRALRNLFDGQDLYGYVGRSVVSGATDVVLTLSSTGVQGLMSTATAAASASVLTSILAAEVVTNTAVCLLFCGFELILWAYGQRTDLELKENCGEHAVGCSAALVGGVVGAAVGSLLGPAGTLVGGILGGIIGSLIGRIVYRAVLNDSKTKNAEAAAEERKREGERELLEAVKASAETMGINIHRDNYDSAKRKFRLEVHACHPDKFAGAPAAVQNEMKEKCSALIVGWNLVRDYYIKNKDAGNAASHDSFVKVWVLKQFDSVQKQWSVVRSFFEKYPNVAQSKTQKLDELVLYM